LRILAEFAQVSVRKTVAARVVRREDYVYLVPFVED